MPTPSDPAPVQTYGRTWTLGEWARFLGRDGGLTTPEVVEVTGLTRPQVLYNVRHSHVPMHVTTPLRPTTRPFRVPFMLSPDSPRTRR